PASDSNPTERCSMFANWLRRTPPHKTQPQARRRKLTCRPRLESLEDRLAPATHIWTGPAVGGLWSNNANWNIGAPTTGEPGGTVIQFDGAIDSTDDIANLVVDQVHFTAGGNILRGTTSLGLDSGVLAKNVLSDTGNSTVDSSLPLVL